MYETKDSGQQAPAEMPQARALKTTDLGIEGLAPAVHLGAGGSANVFAAKQLDTGEAVAVKLLRASADSEKERVRFTREQETLRRLVTHDGIVPVLDAGLTDREEPYFLMPLMEGSLQDRIDSEGALDWQTATQLVVQIADAVAFAHDAHVLHRDLKPGNILLDSSGVPRVSDFGIAKLLDSSVSKSSKSLGTPSFMPPERFNGLEATAESDVYGLGATLAALITGSAPFLTGANDTDVAVMMRVVTEEPPSFEGLDVPDEVRIAVQESMAKDPADRPATAAAFADQLRMAIEPHVDPAMTGPVTVAIPRRNITIPDGPTTGPEKGWTIETTAAEEEDSRKAPVWLIAAAVLLLTGVLGFLGLNALSGSPDADDLASSSVETADGEQVSAVAGATLGSGEGGLDETTGVPLGGDSDDGENAGGDDGADSDSANADGATSSGDSDGSDSATGSDAAAGSDSAGSDGSGDSNGSDSSAGGTTDGSAGGTTDGSGNTGTGSGDETPAKPDDNNEEDNGTTTVEEKPEIEEPPPPAKPVACISPSKTSVETGDSVSFTNCSTDATAYSWDLDGTSSSVRSATKSWTTTGTKTVTLTARGPGGTDTESVRVTVSATPVPPPKPTACFNANYTTVETGQHVSFSNCSSDATSYSWKFGDGSSSSQTSPSKSWSGAGSKTVELTATGPGGTDTATKTITVKAPVVKPDACFSANWTTIDKGGSVTFTNCSKNADSYSWSFGDGGTSTHTSPSHTFNSDGSFTVKLTAKKDGEQDTATKTIKVNDVDDPKPEACFSANWTTIDKGGSVTFTNCSKNADSYSWNFGDGGSSTHTSPSHTFNSKGSFTVTLTAKKDGEQDTATKTIKVNEAPVTTTPDERVRPDRIRCTTHAANDWSWTWTTLPSWVNDYIVVVDGSRISVGKQPASYRTSGKLTAVIAVDKNNHELKTSAPSCDPYVVDAPDVPTGVSCKFSNFRWEDDRWTWQENWSWSAVAGISYKVTIETNGSGSTSAVGGSSVSTNPSNGVPSSGKSVKAIIAVNADGKTATRNVNPCGNEGGSGWQAPTEK